jgi:hypothetical protein
MVEKKNMNVVNSGAQLFSAITGRLTLILLLAIRCAHAQQIPNSDFESWTHYPGRFLFRDYDQPDFWATGNSTLETVPGIDPPTQKTTEAHNGAYAAKMVTASILGQIAPGNLFLGSFRLNIANPLEGVKLGVPFMNKPTGFALWYRYAPVSGDSCIMSVYLVRRNQTTGLRETLGKAAFVSSEKVEAYTPLRMNIVYDSLYTPDSIIVVFSSSAGMEGEKSLGRPGSTLFVDNFELLYEPASIPIQGWQTGSPFPNPADKYLRMPILGDLMPEQELISTDGKKHFIRWIRLGEEWEADVSFIPEGLYILVGRRNQEVKLHKLLILR